MNSARTWNDLQAAHCAAYQDSRRGSASALGLCASESEREVCRGVARSSRSRKGWTTCAAPFHPANPPAEHECKAVEACRPLLEPIPQTGRARWLCERSAGVVAECEVPKHVDWTGLNARIGPITAAIDHSRFYLCWQCCFDAFGAGRV